MKLKIFDHQVARARLTWSTLRQALEVLAQLRRSAPESVVSAVLNEDGSRLDAEQTKLFSKLSKNRKLKRVGLDPLRFAVRLQAVELNYHELGGLFDQLDAAGQVDPVVVTPEEVRHAIHSPPSGGRAEARSKSIEEFHDQPWACDWEYVVNQADEKWVDLHDPFTNKREVTTAGKLSRRRRSEFDALRARIAESV
jgi:hypothetical protein